MMNKESEHHNSPENEITDEFLLTASSEEIARKVAQDEETAKKLTPFIQREKDKLETGRQRNDGVTPKSLERVVIKTLRTLFEHPEIYENYEE